MSSGTRENWRPKVLPGDVEASRQLQEWLAEEEGYRLFGIEHDFRGADLSGGDFTSSWFTQANLTDVRLVEAVLYRADLQSADLTGADLTGADLVRANLDEAVLRSARLDGADMVKASLHGVDASVASFRGTRIMGASLFSVDLRGADLTDATLMQNSFRVTMDDATVVRGLSGTVFGPITVRNGGSVQELAGVELQAWISERGGAIEVIAPGDPVHCS
ncbi:pentapeptide repeat-containing protein [Streptomyces sp. NPDC048111]|uniref:pentapeptide repeat-containing protein n=1 Tax=Streptomyces sp. NPDC048111 TaxID=3365500 RepID=UPI00371D4D99